jgi:hypothetical protein
LPVEADATHFEIMSTNIQQWLTKHQRASASAITKSEQERERVGFDAQGVQGPSAPKYLCIHESAIPPEGPQNQEVGGLRWPWAPLNTEHAVLSENSPSCRAKKGQSGSPHEPRNTAWHAISIHKLGLYPLDWWLCGSGGRRERRSCSEPPARNQTPLPWPGTPGPLIPLCSSTAAFLSRQFLFIFIFASSTKQHLAQNKGHFP